MGRIEAVDDNTVISALGGGMDKEISAQAHGDMPREKEEIAGLDSGTVDGVYRKAFAHGSVPVDQDAILHIGCGAEPGTVES